MIQQTDPVMLKTKIALPAPKDNLVVRERLLNAIAGGQRGRLTIVCAPAGFGKTTLLSQWAHRRKQPCAWVTLDDLDNDAVRFWRHVVHALAAAVPAPIGMRLAQLVRTLPNVSDTTFLDASINELFALPEAVALVLDDYHCIANKRIHESLQYWIDYLPPSVHVLIATRSELPFATAKWMARDERNDIDSLQLQFTADEAAAYYREVSGTALSERHIEQLMQRTEGWVTGLQLVSLSMRGERNVDRFIEQFQGDHRNVADYLFHEVVSRLPSDIYRFLLATSVLDRMDATLCDAVTQSRDSARMLEAVRSWNLFLIPLDERNVWFRYHHLFAQFLQGLLKRTDPEGWARSHRLAAECFATRGLLDEAIDHAIAAEDFARMETYLERHIPTVLLRGEFATLLRWFGSFPEPYAPAAELALLYSFVLVVTGQPQRAERELTSIERICAEMAPSNRKKQLQSGMLFVRSNLVFASGDFDRWFSFAAGIMDDMLPEDPTYYNFNYNMTEPLVRRTSLGLKGALSGDMETIAHLFTGVLESHGWRDSLINLYVKQSLAEGLYEWNRLDDCRQLLPAIERAAASAQIPGLLVPLRITQANVQWAEGNPQLALDTIEEAIKTAVPSFDAHWIDALRACRIRLQVADGKVAEAKKELALLGISAKDKPVFSREYVYLSLVRLLGKQRKESDALRLLELLKPQSAREQLQSSLVEIAILQALMEYQRGQRTAALQHLHEALAVGKRNGYVRSFLDEGKAMGELLRLYVSRGSELIGAAAREDVSKDYVRMLLGLFPGPTKLPHRAPAAAESLSRSELELLRFIRQGASNKQIATELSLSEGTVKVYLSRLYEKLGVSSRTQALLAAQELQLFD